MNPDFEDALNNFLNLFCPACRPHARRVFEVGCTALADGTALTAVHEAGLPVTIRLDADQIRKAEP